MKQQRDKKEYSFNLKLIKLAILSIVFLLSFYHDLPIVFAYYSDQEISENAISAGSLKIEISDTERFSSDLLYPTDTTSISVGIANTGTLDSKYQITTSLLDSAPVCHYVTLTATGPNETYTGLIENFESTATTTGSVVWNYEFEVASDTPPEVWGTTCFFKWSYTAWQNNLSDPLIGFSDRIEKLGSIRVGKAVVLNEVLPNPIGSDEDLKPKGEWVELYNNSSIDFDLAGWAIYNNQDENKLLITNINTNTGGTLIPAHGFLVVYRNGNLDFSLNNISDRVRLVTGYPIDSNTTVDSYTYTMEKPEGFSYARIPDGIGEWVDPIPTPGEANILEADNQELLAPELPISEIKTEMQISSTTLATTTVTEEIISELATSTEATSSAQTNNVIATTTDTVVEVSSRLDIPEIGLELDISSTTEIIEDIPIEIEENNDESESTVVDPATSDGQEESQDTEVSIPELNIETNNNELPQVIEEAEIVEPVVDPIEVEVEEPEIKETEESEIVAPVEGS